nr:hypothetical protein [uncultured Cohaesibacter sp.]
MLENSVLGIDVTRFKLTALDQTGATLPCCMEGGVAGVVGGRIETIVALCQAIRVGKGGKRDLVDSPGLAIREGCDHGTIGNRSRCH